MAKRKTAAQAEDTTPAAGESTGASTETAPAAAAADTAPASETAVTHEPPALRQSSPPPGSEGQGDARREPGDDTRNSWVNKAVSKASVIVDPEAGVKFSFDYEKHQAIIAFDAKPAPELLAAARPILQGGGFRWDRDNEGWTKAIPFASRENDRREAKKTFYALANALREHKGLPARSFGEVMAF